MLEMFKELIIRGDPREIAELTQDLQTARVLGWVHDKEAQERVNELPRTQERDTFVFKWNGQNLPSAKLFLMRDNDDLKVVNIVPSESGRLTKPQYNSLLDDFAERFVKPLASKRGLRLETSPSHRDISDWLSPRAKRSLEAFSRCANKGTGSAHPSDNDRWLNFIIQVHQDGCSLNSSLLERWLIEEENWPLDVASDLAIEFEQGINLLVVYDGGR